MILPLTATEQDTVRRLAAHPDFRSKVSELGDGQREILNRIWSQLDWHKGCVAEYAGYVDIAKANVAFYDKILSELAA